MANDQRTRPTDDDEGKDVIDSTGETIGIVSSVEDGTIHVETDPGLTDSIKATLGWGDTEDTQTIDEQHVSEIDDAVHLAGEDPDATSVNAGGAGAMSADPDTGSTTGRDEAVDGDADDAGDPTTPQTTEADRTPEDETAVSKTPMDDTGDVTGPRTTEHGDADEMTENQVDEGTDPAEAEEMGVPSGDAETDANERPPGVEDTSGREDVQDSQVDESRGTEDVQDPVPEEPRDSEDVRDTSEELNPESEADPEDQPSTGEAATRGAEEDAELGRESDDDEDRDDRPS